MHAIEMDNHRYKHTFDGITRLDVENMLKYKVEKEESEKKLS